MQTDRGCAHPLLPERFARVSPSAPVGALFIFAPGSAVSLPPHLRALSVVSTHLPIRRFPPSSLTPVALDRDGRGEEGEQKRSRAASSVYPAAVFKWRFLTRRKIICKNPYKICRPPPLAPLMHREIVALYRRAYGIIISPCVSPSPTIDRSGKRVQRALGPASNPTRVLFVHLILWWLLRPTSRARQSGPFSIADDLLGDLTGEKLRDIF